MPDERTYRLRVSGTVKYKDEDKGIEDMLLNLTHDPDERLEVAYQELQESATDLAVSMELLE